MTDALPSPVARRLGYLLKTAQRRLAEAAAPAMAPFGIDGRELTVLAVLWPDAGLSQQDAAERLGIDRTTMVSLVDALEDKGLVERRRSHDDRRKNTVQLTPVGRRTLRDAGQARDEAERNFLAPLGPAEAERFVRALQVLATDQQPGPDGRAPYGMGLAIQTDDSTS